LIKLIIECKVTFENNSDRDVTVSQKRNYKPLYKIHNEARYAQLSTQLDKLSGGVSPHNIISVQICVLNSQPVNNNNLISVG